MFVAIVVQNLARPSCPQTVENLIALVAHTVALTKKSATRRPIYCPTLIWHTRKHLPLIVPTNERIMSSVRTSSSDQPALLKRITKLQTEISMLVNKWLDCVYLIILVAAIQYPPAFAVAHPGYWVIVLSRLLCPSQTQTHNLCTLWLVADSKFVNGLLNGIYEKVSFGVCKLDMARPDTLTGNVNKRQHNPPVFPSTAFTLFTSILHVPPHGLAVLMQFWDWRFTLRNTGLRSSRSLWPSDMLVLINWRCTVSRMVF